MTSTAALIAEFDAQQNASRTNANRRQRSAHQRESIARSVGNGLRWAVGAALGTVVLCVFVALI